MHRYLFYFLTLSADRRGEGGWTGQERGGDQAARGVRADKAVGGQARLVKVRAAVERREGGDDCQRGRQDTG